MAYTDIIVEKKGKAAWITLNKPHVMNALGSQTWLDLLAALDDIENDPEMMVAVIKGAEGTFCAGADLKEITERLAKNDPKLDAAFTALFDRGFNGVKNFRKVSIAMVNGVCMAGGFELAEVCDFIIADENCKIGDGHIRTGIIPNGGASIRLPRLISMRKAKELLYTGALISGKEAERIGLVNRAVPADKLEEAVEEFLARLVDKPPLALEAVKMLVDRGVTSSEEAGIVLEHQAVTILQGTEDFQESMAAFREKRKPVYKGR